MRDDRHKWAPARTSDASIDLRTATLTPVQLTRQTLISGPDLLQQIDLPLIEWPAVAAEPRYALCLRRDRVLIVNGPSTPEGWDGTCNQAISDASDSYATFDLIGTGAMDLLKRGTEISLDVPSRSVVRRAFGLDLLVYRIASPDGFRLHVPSALQEALIGHLQAASSHMPD